MVGKASAGSLNWVALRRRGWSVLMELSLLSIDVQAKWAGGRVGGLSRIFHGGFECGQRLRVAPAKSSEGVATCIRTRGPFSGVPSSLDQIRECEHEFKRIRQEKDEGLSALKLE